MTNDRQLPLGAPFESRSITSREAARSVLPLVAGQEAKVLDAIRSGGNGATDEEIERITGLKHQSASARRRGLVIKGFVRDSGITRTTSSGRRATVWMVVT